ncbi:MAG: AzlC family ABC transporter permease [Acutalibacteraceae bacterium]|jgi:predicted branched-subunit amino acid permease
MNGNAKWYKKGLRDGLPIALGYFAVSFTLGIMAKKSGLTAFQAMLAAALTNASAGGYAGFALIAQGASYLEMAVTQLIVNARYFLMSCALSQKFSLSTPLLHRSLVAFNITDEVFGISVASDGYLNPFYNYGAMSVTIPGWALGTFSGVVMGNVLPTRLFSALSVGLYGMFLAIIVPPCRKSRIIAAAVMVSWGLSYAFYKLPVLCKISTGIKVIILTLAISFIFAILFPVNSKEDENAA